MKSINEYIINDGFALLRIVSRKHGEFHVKIDIDDVDKCRQHQWAINKYNRKTEKEYCYATSRTAGLLHRYIMDAPKGMDVDHKNGDTLDNRKNKLQVCNHNENIMKSQTRSDNNSGRVGVYFNDKLKTPKWMAYININKKRKHLGFFNTIEEAISARENAENEHWSDFRPIDTLQENI